MDSMDFFITHLACCSLVSSWNWSKSSLNSLTLASAASSFLSMSSPSWASFELQKKPCWIKIQRYSHTRITHSSSWSLSPSLIFARSAVTVVIWLSSCSSFSLWAFFWFSMASSNPGTLMEHVGLQMLRKYRACVFDYDPPFMVWSRFLTRSDPSAGGGEAGA